MWTLLEANIYGKYVTQIFFTMPNLVWSLIKHHLMEVRLPSEHAKL